MQRRNLVAVANQSCFRSGYNFWTPDDVGVVSADTNCPKLSLNLIIHHLVNFSISRRWWICDGDLDWYMDTCFPWISGDEPIKLLLR